MRGLLEEFISISKPDSHLALYGFLRRNDRQRMSRVAVEPYPQAPLTKATNDFEQEIMAKLHRSKLPLLLHSADATYFNWEPGEVIPERTLARFYRLSSERFRASIEFDVSFNLIFGQQCHVKILHVLPWHQGNYFRLKTFLQQVGSVVFHLENNIIARIFGRGEISQYPVRGEEWRNVKVAGGYTKLVRLYHRLGFLSDAGTPGELSWLNPYLRKYLLEKAANAGLRLVTSCPQRPITLLTENL